ncbi:MAG TPA: hypothetical protein VFI93_03235 [Rhizomicrobium sp.]|nr:hypothetical protein [Rhizomicrobium sp.]
MVAQLEKFRPIRTIRRFVLLAAAGVLVSACAQPAAYAPQGPRGGPGYSDTQLAKNRYRVTFRGNSVTARATVENYLLRRAAEVTKAAGYPAFEFDTRDTKADTTYRSQFSGWPGWNRPDPFGWYWHSWAFGPGPYGYAMSSDAMPITRYEAYAEIVMLTDAQAKNRPRALYADDVLSHLGPPPPPPPGAPPPPPPGASRS